MTERETGTRAPAGGDERLDRIAAEVRVDRERIDRGRGVLAPLDVGVGVRARRRADVAPLAVCDDEQPGGASVSADVLEGAQAVGTECLEERELQLHPY